MELKILLSGFMFISVTLLGYSQGDKVFIRLPHVKLDNNGRCLLPGVVSVTINQLSTVGGVDMSPLATVGVEAVSHLTTLDAVYSDVSIEAWEREAWEREAWEREAWEREAWEIRLERSEDKPTTSFIYIMRQDGNRKYYLDLQKLDNNDEVFHSYHNSSFGAAVNIKCVKRNDGSGQFYRLDGTVFKEGRKFILSSSLEPFNTGNSSLDHVTAAYDMKHVEEHKIADAAWVKGGQNGDTVYEKHGKTAHTDKVHHHRVKRQTTSYSIDILTFIDVSMYRKWLLVGSNDGNITKAMIKAYMANVYTSVNMRLETLTLSGIKLRVKMLPIVFPGTENESPWTTKEYAGNDVKVNATKLLNDFSNWLKQQTGFSYDHAVLLTSYDIYGGSDVGNKFNITKGLAYIGTLCLGAESSSIIEEKGAYQSEGIIAHELGHSLGALHDGQGNLCSPESRYLMADGTYSANASNSLNPWKFSSCSSSAILKQIKKLQDDPKYRDNCLQKDIELGEEETTFTPKEATEQCQSFYGSASFACRGLSIPSFSHICDEFYCHVPGTDVCERMTAPLGMCCGHQKQCKQGQCQNATTGECPMDDECPLGDQPGIVLNNKTCSQLESAYCYDPDYNVKCCKTCKEWKEKVNQANCVYGDKRAGCRSDICNAFTDGIANKFFCCNTCLGLPQADNTKVTVGAKEYTCQELIKEKTPSICYNPDVHLDSCPIACESVRDESSSTCPWGDRNNCTLYIKNLSTNSNCSDNRVFNCCKSCADIAASRITTVASTTRPTTTVATTTRPTTTVVTTTRPTTTVATTTRPTTTVATTTRPTTTVATTTRPTTTVANTTRHTTTVATTTMPTTIFATASAVTTTITKPTSTVTTSTTRPSSTVTTTTTKSTTMVTTLKPFTGTATSKPTVRPTARKIPDICDILACSASLHFNLTFSITMIIFSTVLCRFLN
ncbi:unnamed protein product [Lymnaea stagnalis]|uniref:Peptidase M12B domain-containing protein n=1 Tax=Lymnaea stagnalis TaxID=6523 RepID=A0AAV2IE77_LYMST